MTKESLYEVLFGLFVRNNGRVTRPELELAVRMAGAGDADQAAALAMMEAEGMRRDRATGCYDWPLIRQMFVRVGEAND